MECWEGNVRVGGCWSGPDVCLWSLWQIEKVPVKACRVGGFGGTICIPQRRLPPWGCCMVGVGRGSCETTIDCFTTSLTLRIVEWGPSES